MTPRSSDSDQEPISPMEETSVAFGDPAHSQDPVMLASDRIWEEYKGLILGGAAAVVILAIGWVSWVLYSQQQRRDAETLFATANTAEQLKEVIARYPNSVLAANSQLLMAALEREKGNLSEAGQWFEQASNAPGYSLAGSGALGVAEIAASENPSAAPTAYAEVMVAHPNSYAAPFALYLQADAFLRAGDRDSSLRAFRALVADYPESISAQIARMQLARLSPRDLPTPR